MLTPKRIIWRWVHSPHSNKRVSPSRTRVMAETLRSTVGRAAEVPRKVTESMAGNIGRQWGGRGRQKAAGICAAPCRHLPPVTALENLDRQVPPRPLFQIRKELRQGLERRIQIFIQQRIRRDFAERPFSLIHLVEQSLQRPGRVVGTPDPLP